VHSVQSQRFDTAIRWSACDESGYLSRWERLWFSFIRRISSLVRTAEPSCEIHMRGSSGTCQRRACCQRDYPCARSSLPSHPPRLGTLTTCPVPPKWMDNAARAVSGAGCLYFIAMRDRTNDSFGAVATVFHYCNHCHVKKYKSHE
jgi:hypothetical protein